MQQAKLRHFLLRFEANSINKQATHESAQRRMHIALTTLSIEVFVHTTVKFAASLTRKCDRI